MILFSIADSGIGIADDHLPDLFKVFSQVSEGYARNYQGAGLGLSICKRLVELMGGSICLMTESGVGSSFWFALPFELADPVQSHRLVNTDGIVPRSNFVGLSILLAEDDSVSGYATVRLIEKLGVKVLHVVNGKEALDALRNRQFDLVLMDVQMPVMDGVAATGAIRGGEVGNDARNVPIIALTAYAMDGDMATFLAAGMNDYLPKPIRVKDLEALIVKWFPAGRL